jgi:hypothetical protein
MQWWRTTDGKPIQADLNATLTPTMRLRWFLDYDDELVLEQLHYNAGAEVWVPVPRKS